MSTTQWADIYNDIADRDLAANGFDRDFGEQRAIDDALVLTWTQAYVADPFAVPSHPLLYRSKLAELLAGTAGARRNVPPEAAS
jgi:hypothetical protein